MYITCHACDEEYQSRSNHHCPHCGSLDEENYDD